MMTPQEVANSTFPKAALGGYNMAAVDVFLDKLTEDYTTIYKENAALKAKMKVLVDKMEEYHAMEDTMRSTLLTAQKMANSLITEAEAKRDALISNAEADARVRMRELAADVAAEERRLAAVHEDIDRQIAVEQERLTVAQRELSAFINAAKALCSRQFELIDRLEELDVLPAGFTVAQPEAESAEPEIEEAPAAESAKPVQPAVDADVAVMVSEVVGDTGSDASKLMERMNSVIDSFVKDEPIPEKEEDPFAIDFDDAQSLFGDVAVEKDREADEEEVFDNFTDEDENATRVINLDDLQFGRNYNKD